MGRRCERVSVVAGGLFNGMRVVLPGLMGEMGGGLEDDAMERLKGDGLSMGFARLL